MQIELQDVRKAFGQTQVLRGVSFNAPSGGRIALIGPNGSGKSTLLRSLLGLLSCEGTVRLGGLSPFDDRLELSHKIAYVPQVAPAMSATVKELVSFVSSTRGISASVVHEVARRLELELESVRDRPFRNLSGGMKQKLLITLALAAKPALIVMDEPTASLDSRARDRFFQLFDELAPECTVVLCSHRLEELRSLSDHIVSLSDGLVTWSGAASAFLSLRSMSVLEVYLDRPDAEGWLVARGFSSAVPGWWSRTVSQAEKLQLLPAMTTELGPLIQNLLVRDLESIELGRTGAGDA